MYEQLGEQGMFRESERKTNALPLHILGIFLHTPALFKVFFLIIFIIKPLIRNTGFSDTGFHPNEWSPVVQNPVFLMIKITQLLGIQLVTRIALHGTRY